MFKTVHFIPLLCLVICSAALTAFVVHAIAIRFISFPQDQSLYNGQGNSQKSTGKDSLFPKDGYGVYILPTVNPTFPLEPGAGAVGGVTGCARLDNLRTCLDEKGSALASEISTPHATVEAGLEQVCSDILNKLASKRLASIEAGCIW